MKENRDKYPELPPEIQEALLNCKAKYKWVAWSAFGTLWEWAIKQSWFGEFIDSFWREWHKNERWITYSLFLSIEYFNPDKFADALFSFLKERK